MKLQFKTINYLDKITKEPKNFTKIYTEVEFNGSKIEIDLHCKNQTEYALLCSSLYAEDKKIK